MDMVFKEVSIEELRVKQQKSYLQGQYISFQLNEHHHPTMDRFRHS